MTAMTRCGLGLALLAAGCSNYYQTNDPATGKIFYSTKVKQTGQSGAEVIR